MMFRKVFGKFRKTNYSLCNKESESCLKTKLFNLEFLKLFTLSKMSKDNFWKIIYNLITFLQNINFIPTKEGKIVFANKSELITVYILYLYSLLYSLQYECFLVQHITHSYQHCCSRGVAIFQIHKYNI